MTLMLNAERRYIQALPFTKVAVIQHHGGYEITKGSATRWPRKEGKELVAVVDNGAFDAAVWVQDQRDHDDVMREFTRPIRFFEIASEELTDAEVAPDNMARAASDQEAEVG
ncbi:MAG: hypothetical protein WBG86_14505 [Polyangiales bacterium]